MVRKFSAMNKNVYFNIAQVLMPKQTSAPGMLGTISWDQTMFKAIEEVVNVLIISTFII